MSSKRDDARPKGAIGPDLILLLLRAPTDIRNAQDAIHGITRLEKLLFLADRETSIRDTTAEPFDFRPYNFGPYSKEIYQAVELLEEVGLLREERVLEGTALDEMEELSAALDEQEGVERRFFLTDDGRAVADLLQKKHPELAEQLRRIKEKYAGLPLRRLIRDVYSRYPAMASQSIIRDRI